jgi:hypothetical protein
VAGNVRVVLKFGLPLALVGAAIEWGQEELGRNFVVSRWIDPNLTALFYLVEVAVFWLTPAALLGLTWGCLPGRRGTGRAVAVWLPFAIAFTSAWLIPYLLGLAPAGRWLFFASLLLLTLLVAALATDLTTIRALNGRSRPAAGVARLYGLNKTVAVLGLILPLIGSGLTLWGQLQNGVLREPTSTQQQVRTTSTPDTPTGSTPPTTPP